MTVSHLQVLRASLLSITQNINDLPNEILGMIFAISLAHQRSVLSPFMPLSSRSYVTPHLGYHDRTDAPFVFLQVCSRWRCIAKSSRALWASLSACQYGHVASTGVPLAAFGYWLSLSDNLPLHLFVDTPRNYKTGRRRVDHHTAMHSQKLMAVLAEDRHLTRWKSISVVLTSALCTQLTETLIHRYYTLHSPIGLERIEIEVPNQSLPVTQLLQAIGLVPALRVLFWRSIFSSQFQTFIELPLLGQLTRILLHMPMSVCEATMFLAKCKTAAHVTLKGIYTQSELVPPFIETLSKLTELNLSGIQNVVAVLDNILCPGLEILDIDNRTSRPHPQSWESLDAFFKRSQAKPNRVVIRHTSELSSDDLAGYLRIGQQSGIPYYMITSRHAHATANTVLEHKYGLGPFTRYVRTPGGGEYVGMDRRAHSDWNSDKISLRDVYSPIKE